MFGGDCIQSGVSQSVGASGTWSQWDLTDDLKRIFILLGDFPFGTTLWENAGIDFNSKGSSAP